MNDMEKNLVSEGSEDFAAMLEETMIKFRPGQVVKGVVAQVSDDGVVVSIPGKADGYIKKNDLVTTDCKVDDEIEAEVVKLNDGEGYVLLSERKVMATKNWEKLVAEYDTGAYVEATGREAVNGGLTGTFSAPAGGDKVLRKILPFRMTDQAEADRFAKGLLRDANKEATVATLWTGTLLREYAAGSVVTLSTEGVASWDGTAFVSRIRHDYVKTRSKLYLRKPLEGY